MPYPAPHAIDPGLDDLPELIGVGEDRCPFCGAWRPGLYGFAPKIQRFFGNRLDIIPLIVRHPSAS